MIPYQVRNDKTGLSLRGVIAYSPVLVMGDEASILGDCVLISIVHLEKLGTNHFITLGVIFTQGFRLPRYLSEAESRRYFTH